MRRMPKLKIKAGVWQWLALGCGCVGMMFGLGFAGEAEALGNISDTQFATALALLMAALLFVRLGDAAAKREKAEAARRKCLRRYAADARTSQSVAPTALLTGEPKRNADKNRHSA